MATLTRRLIKEYVDRGDLIIDPFFDSRVEPASYDAGIGNKILASPLGPDERGEIITLTEESPEYSILTGQMVAVISEESFRFPLDLISGNFGIKSHYARRGINSFRGPQLDPGWRGRVVLCLQNVGPEPVRVKLGEPFITIQFDRLEEPAEAYEGPHQDQDDFPQDQVDFILSARTTSLAEIPKLRNEIKRLSTLVEGIDDRIPDPDEGLELRPEIKEQLLQASKTPRHELLSAEEFWKQMGLEE